MPLNGCGVMADLSSVGMGSAWAALLHDVKEPATAAKVASAGYFNIFAVRDCMFMVRMRCCILMLIPGKDKTAKNDEK